MMRSLLAFSLLLVLACGGGDGPSAATPAAPASAAPVAPVPPSAPAAPYVNAAVPPCDVGALLVAHDFLDVQQRYCELCKAHDEMACELDWPSSDVPSCKMYDEFRNRIYAYYGYSFSNAEWQAYFSTVSWYRPDPAYSEARLSPAAQRNIAFLQTAKAEKRACMD